MDMTWVNGVPVGSGGNPGAPREYRLPAGTFHAGRNFVIVNAHDVWANGGMPGPAEIMKLVLADGTALPLGTGWQYSIERRDPPGQPRVPWDDVAGAGVIYNAMIAPLGRLGLKGVAWYQGESDTDIPGYAGRLAAMMADWRRQFGAPALPFAIVQLAGLRNAGDAGPGRAAGRRCARSSGWRRRATAMPRSPSRSTSATRSTSTPARSTRSAGDWRAAMAALAYGNAAPASGPEIRSARRLPDGGVELAFAGVDGRRSTRAAAPTAIGFELCGEADPSCRYATARAEGDRVVVAGDGQPVTRVRYAWADSPTVNLFDDVPLPAGPFEVAVP